MASELQIRIGGTYPREEEPMRMFRESGFDEYLKTSLPAAFQNRGAILKQDLSLNAKQADGEYARRLVDFAAKDDGRKLRLKASFAHLVECMGNTHQHAADVVGTESWWASVFKDRRRQRDCFTFVDMGVGIFNSIELSARLRLMNLLNTYRPTILKELLAGRIPSSTRLRYRGRGLPSIFESCKKGRIDRLVILTNDVFADIESDKYLMLSSELRGVILYWEVPYADSRSNA